jgi:hypothetical protein
MLLARIVLVMSLLLVPSLVVTGCGSDDGSESNDARSSSAEPEGEAAPGIVPGESIAGVAVGDPLADVQAALGDPVRDERLDNEISGAADDHLEWDEPRVEVTMAPIQPFDDRDAATTEAVQVSTIDDSLRTAEDIGVGSSRSEVEETYDLECDAETISICRLEATDNVVTDFFVKDDLVTRVVVGRIID